MPLWHPLVRRLERDGLLPPGSYRRTWRREFALALLLLIILPVLLFACVPAIAAPIPAAAQQHQRLLTRIVQQEWGLNGSVAVIAAQIHQESTWRSDVDSHAGAQGLAQFMPATADWIVTLYPDLGHAAPYSPGWAMRALVRYDRHIMQRVKPWHARDVPLCDLWAFTLSGYNGGPGWIERDRRLAQDHGRNPDRWWEHVEHTTSRADWARNENRAYPRRILLELEPRYRAAGWHGEALCH